MPFMYVFSCSVHIRLLLFLQVNCYNDVMILINFTYQEIVYYGSNSTSHVKTKGFCLLLPSPRVCEDDVLPTKNRRVFLLATLGEVECGHLFSSQLFTKVKVFVYIWIFAYIAIMSIYTSLKYVASHSRVKLI